MKKTLSVNSLLAIAMLSCLVANADGTDTIVAQYRAIEAQSVNVDQWKAHTNENGTLAWNTSYVLMSYLDIYDVTHDAAFLDKFVALSDPLIGSTDDKRGLADYKGRQRAGWGTTSYGAGKRVVFLVHSGMISYPLLRFCNLVKKDSSLGRYASRAPQYQALSTQALKAFDGDWRPDSTSAKGRYVFGSNHPLANQAGETPLPYNMELAAGSAFIELWKLTGDRSYQARATAMAQDFKDALHTDSSGAYVWNYGPVSYSKTNPAARPAPEDVSHAGTDILFVVLAAQNGIVFTKEDLSHFAKSYSEFESQVKTPADRDALDRFIALAWGSCPVYDSIRSDLMARKGHQDAQILFALSELAKYEKVCAH
jgi:hypothetical protein